jgi:hypothetical protein
MAKISTYPILSTPTLNDLLIGTDVENLNITKNFSIGDIASFIIGGSYVPYVGATGNVNLGAFNITSSSFIVGGGLATQFLKANGTLDSTVYQPAGNYITQLSGEATASGPGNATVTLSNSAVINKVLTGLNITGSSILATDSILTAFGKVQNQINTLVGGVQYQGTWNASTNTPTLTSSVGVQGHYYVVSVPGSTNLNGITDWKLGDWAIYNGTAWDKIDNTDAVISVNGEVGAVVLTTTNISEGTNLYFTNSRARTAINLTTTGNSGAATYNNTNGFFNIPEYTLAGLGGVPLTRQLTINGTAFDLSANRSWNVGTVTSVGTSGPLTGGTITGSGTIGITQAGASLDGYLSSTDWTTFNSKQNALTNPVTGTGTIFTLPMWGGATSLIDSPLSYGSNNFNFQYNSATGGTVNFTNIGLTAYTYSIQMNNFGSPRSTVHSYTDGVVAQSIGGTQVSRMFANGNLILGTGTADNGHKLELSGSLFVNTIANATVDTDRFIVSDGGVIKYRTGTELRSDIGAGVGSVTSVGLTMPSAFSVANSPITGSGTLAVTGAGVASQYVRGDGTLADFPTNTGGGSSVSYYLNGSVSQGTIGGVAYRELSEIPIFGAGTDISIAADGYIASFITDAGDPALLNIPAGNWNFETYFSASSGGGTPSFYVELYRYDGTTFTLIASSSSVPELISFGTNIQPYFSTLAVPQTALALTDRLAIRYYVITSGRTITLHTEDNHLCQVITTFSNGLTALNGLTEQVQYFQVGTAGTDFNIVSSVATHTFNLPDASATARGLVTTGSQVFGGVKTFANGLALPSLGGTNQVTRIVNIGTIHEGSAGSNQIGFNNSNNIYFGKGLSNGGVIQWTNAAVRYYTLPDADGTLALASQLDGYVTLGTAQTITGQKTFNSTIVGQDATLTSSGSNQTLLVTHSSGSGIALDISKGGNGEGLRVTKTSGSGNAVTITGGALSAVAGQFSGDVQTATRFAASSGSNGITITPNVGGTQNRIETTGSLPLSLVSAAAITMAAGGTTPQITLATTGAVTLTGALNGTSASFISTIANPLHVETSGSDGGIQIYRNVNSDGGSAALFMSHKSTAGVINTANIEVVGSGSMLFRTGAVGLGNFGTTRLTISSTGAATFSSSVTATEIRATTYVDSTNQVIANNTITTPTNDTTLSNGTVYALNGISTTNNYGIGVSGIRNGNYDIWFQTGSTNGGGYRFYKGTSELMTIATSGNVGIGTAGSPWDTIKALQIGQAGNFFSGFQGGSAIYMGTAAYYGSGGWKYATTGDAGNLLDLGSGNFIFSNCSSGTTGNAITWTERMRITSGGYLKASNTGSYLGGSYHELRTNRTDDWSTIISNSNSSSPYGLSLFYTNASPNNADNWFIFCEDSTAARFRVASNGNVTNVNGSYGSISDAKLKENIEDATPKLDDLLKVKVRNYNLIGEETKQIGVIAQELEEIFPAMIDESEDFEEVEVPQLDEEGNEVLNEEGEVVTEKQRVSKGTTTKSVKYSVFVPMLIKAIQEQQEQINQLKNQIK